MGLAIGAGFYFGGVVCCGTIILIVTLLDRVQNRVVSHCNHLRLFVIYNGMWSVLELIKNLHEAYIFVDDFEMIPTESKDRYGVVLLVKSLKHCTHDQIIKTVRELDGVVMAIEM